MRFLADENISNSLIKTLRSLNHDVIDLKEKKLQGLNDNLLVKKANEENRIILTHDKDFSNISMHPLKNQRFLGLGMKSSFLNFTKV